MCNITQVLQAFLRVRIDAMLVLRVDECYNAFSVIFEKSIFATPLLLFFMSLIMANCKIINRCYLIFNISEVFVRFVNAPRNP